MPDSYADPENCSLPRRVMFLQGPSSPFFGRVAQQVAARGGDVMRVGFCPGDRLFWPRALRYIPFRDRAGLWPQRCTELLTGEGVSDLVCLGDGRPLHAAAIAVARKVRQATGQRLRIWIVEHGYLRPGWLVVEQDGFAANSRLAGQFDALRPTDPPRPDPAYRSSFAAYAAMDVAYHAANLCAGRLCYPGYRSAALDGPLAEWRGWLGKAMRKPARQRAARAVMARAVAHPGPLFLFPLQLDTDFQIRDHCPGGQEATLSRVLDSFAHHAPADALLVVKTHPLDNGLRDRRAMLRRDRVLLLDGGDLATLLARAHGVVVINSTVGLSALRSGCAVKVLGQALYDRPGLTDSASLDRFWVTPSGPEPAQVAAFCRFLQDRAMVEGAFDGEGAGPGAAHVAARIMETP